FCPSTDFRFSSIDFLLRDCTYHHRLVPFSKTLHFLSGSPVSLFSTLMTSAPKSANNLPAKGPAINEPNSKTFKLFNAALFTFITLVLLFSIKHVLALIYN